jgi:hypothetical protein
LKYEAIKSVMAQTVPVDMLVLLTKKSVKPTIAERIADALNEGVAHIRLADFDYLLRMDGDTILARTFLEKNLVGEPDVRGNGYAHLIKVKTFLELMNGKYHHVADDQYLNSKFKQYGKKAGRLIEEPRVYAGHPFDVKYFVDRGRLLYLLGWFPLHVMATMSWNHGKDWYKHIFAVGSYFLSFIVKPQKFDVAEFDWNYQVRSEVRHLTRFFKLLNK